MDDRQYKKFLRAVKKDDIEYVKGAIKLGLNPNHPGAKSYRQYPLYVAIKNNSHRTFNFLINCRLNDKNLWWRYAFVLANKKERLPFSHQMSTYMAYKHVLR